MSKNPYQIILDELLPISEAPMSSEKILVKVKGESGLDIAQRYFWTCTWTVGSDDKLRNRRWDDLEGWIPMPVYQPKEPEE